MIGLDLDHAKLQNQLRYTTQNLTEAAQVKAAGSQQAYCWPSLPMREINLEHKTLEELKRENEAEENTQVEPEAEIDEVEDELPDDVEAEADDDDEGEEEQPAWMSEDSDSQPSEKLFTGSDIAAAKRKLKGKLEEKTNEVEELRQKVELLQQSLQQRSAQPAVNAYQKPTRDMFLDSDDPDEAYVEALTDWKLSTKAAQSQQYMRQQQRQQAVEQAQNRHYEAAAKLITDHGISEDVYRQADAQFKRGLDAVRSGAGELIANELIAQMGEGSEKVTFMLGRNPQKMAQLQQALMEDPNGIKASILLGRMQAEVNTSGRKATRQTPPPAKRVQGDAGGSSQSNKLKKQYQQAHKRGDAQGAFNARRAARQAGVDVSDW